MPLFQFGFDWFLTNNFLFPPNTNQNVQFYIKKQNPTGRSVWLFIFCCTPSPDTIVHFFSIVNQCCNIIFSGYYDRDFHKFLS